MAQVSARQEFAELRIECPQDGRRDAGPSGLLRWQKYLPS